jgi:hypothetical protein
MGEVKKSMPRRMRKRKGGSAMLPPSVRWLA